MNRRTFIQGAATTVSGLTARIGIGGTQQSVQGLLDWLEQSRREDIPRDATRLIRSGLRYEDLLTALCLAAVRNVQPYPDVGYKYHAVMVLRSIHSATAQREVFRWVIISPRFRNRKRRFGDGSSHVCIVGDRIVEGARRELHVRLEM